MSDDGSDDEALEALHPSLAAMARSPHMMIHQLVEFEEALWGYEVENQYAITDASGHEIMIAAEEGGGCGSFLTRQFLNARRPFVLHVGDPSSGELLMQMKRPFKIYFDRVEVSDPDGGAIGVVQRRFSIINRKYTLDDADGETVFTVKGPIWKPWTFEVYFEDADEPCAVIRKQWSGFGREIFTDSDSFGVEWQDDVDPEERMMILSAVFLIDFRHFESSNRR